MKYILKIPYEEKEFAKIEAKNNGCALYFDKQEKTWILSGKNLPDNLQKYLINSENLNNNNYTYFIDYPYDLYMNNKNNSNNNLKYHSLYKSFYIILKNEENIPYNLLPYLSQPFSYEYWLEVFVNKKVRPQLKEIIDSNHNNVDKWQAREHQKKAANLAENAFKNNIKGFLIADDVGLGKTISSLQACRQINLINNFFNKKTILVVTTISAIAHWRNTFLNFNTKDMQILIINYDRLQKLFYQEKINESFKNKAKSRKTKNKRIAQKALAPYFNICIFDESHKMKNSTSLRAKLGKKIAQISDFNIYLSATAGQNPLELSYLTPLISSILKIKNTDLDNFDKWCEDYLGVKKGKYGGLVWDGSEQSINKLRNLLFNENLPCAIRRLPEDIAGWPEINRILEESIMTPDKQYLYNLSWEEFRNEKKKNNTDIGLVANLRFRQKASLIKIDATIEKIKDCLENNQQVAVSIAFIDTLEEIKKILNKNKIICSIINGKQSKNENEEQRLKFQRGENKVILFTVEEAISLHEGELQDSLINLPRTLIIHDIRWSAISMKQIEGRTHRDGKFSQVYWQYLENSIEKDIANIVVKKMIQMKSMVGDDTQTLKEIELLLKEKIEISI